MVSHSAPLQSFTPQPALIQLPQDLLQRKHRQGGVLDCCWISAVLQSSPAAGFLQLAERTPGWWAVLQAGVPVSRVGRVWDGGVGRGGGRIRLRLSREHQCLLHGTEAAHLQRFSPWGGGRAARTARPVAPQRRAGVQMPPLLMPKQGTEVCVLLGVGISSRTLPIIAALLHLLLHSGRVGRWGVVRSKCPRPGSGVERVVPRTVRLPQSFLGSFTLQRASSSVLEPHLNRKNRRNFLSITGCLIRLGGGGQVQCMSAFRAAGSVYPPKKQDPDKKRLCHLCR